MFYDNFIRACEKKGLSPSAVLRRAGASTGNIERWRNGVLPKAPMLKRLSEALDVPISELNSEAPSEVENIESAELVDYLDQLRDRPEMRMLFSVAKNASKEDVEAIVHFIESLRKS